MATLLNIKEFVADQLGSGNATANIAERDRLINRARSRFYSERKWSFLRKTATLTFTNKLAPLPTDYNKKFDPLAVYTYSTTNKDQYCKVPYDDVDMYGEEYFYAIDKVSGKIKIYRTNSTLTIDYISLPADCLIDGTDNSDVEPISDITPIGILAIAMWYLSQEKNPEMYKLFMSEYKQLLSEAIRSDASSIAPRRFNRPVRINSGYKQGA